MYESDWIVCPLCGSKIYDKLSGARTHGRNK